MSSSAPGPQHGGDFRQEVSAEGPSPAQPTHTRGLLESVLRQTLQESSSPEDLDPTEKAALMEVAARHRGAALTPDPIVVELVEAILTAHFRNLSGSAELFSSISGEIAQSLFDDPAARPRLEAFWDRLCTTSP